MGHVPHGAGHGGPWGSATTVRYLLVWKGRGRQGRRGGQAEEDNALLKPPISSQQGGAELGRGGAGREYIFNRAEKYIIGGKNF